MAKQRILVTGGAGYIGAHTTVELLLAGYDAIIIDDLSRSDHTLISGIEKITGTKANFHQGNCLDRVFLQHIFQSQGPFDCVIHFAAYKSVSESVENPLLYYHNNVGSMVALLETMSDFKVANFIFSSSCTVYGQPDHVPVDELAPLKRAESPYGATKQMCEQILEDSSKNSMRAVSLRYFNPVGAHPSAHIGELPIGVPGNLVPFITQTAAGKREKLTVFGNDYSTPDGSCIRDFIHVVDVAAAHLKAMEYLFRQPSSSLFEIFNLGTGKGVSVLELISAFQKSTGVKLSYTIGPRRPGDVEQVYANPAKANVMLDWKTKYTIEEGLLHAWKWQQHIK